MDIIMVKEMVKEILKKEVEVVRVDVVGKDELMAYSKGSGKKNEFDGPEGRSYGGKVAIFIVS